MKQKKVYKFLLQLILISYFIISFTTFVNAEENTYTCGQGTVTVNTLLQGAQTKVNVDIKELPSLNVMSYEVIVKHKTPNGSYIKINDGDINIGKSGNGSVTATVQGFKINPNDLEITVQHGTITFGRDANCIIKNDFSVNYSTPPANKEPVTTDQNTINNSSEGKCEFLFGSNVNNLNFDKNVEYIQGEDKIKLNLAASLENKYYEIKVGNTTYKYNNYVPMTDINLKIPRATNKIEEIPISATVYQDATKKVKEGICTTSVFLDHNKISGVDTVQIEPFKSNIDNTPPISASTPLSESQTVTSNMNTNNNRMQLNPQNTSINANTDLGEPERGTFSGWDISRMLNQASPENTVKKIVFYVYTIFLPISVLVAIIKILIALIPLAASSGDPNNLSDIKSEITAILSGLILVGGAVTLINILGSALQI